MTIGASIFLIAVGAILYFATNFHVAHVDIDIVGLILMAAGAAGLVLGFIQQDYWSRRSRREVVVDDRRDPVDPRY
jgi:drug/metabolite transporter (DMT)-like permease